MTAGDKSLFNWIGESWNEFWFPRIRCQCSGRNAARIRTIACGLALVWFVVQLENIDWYFGDAKWLSAEIAIPLNVATEGVLPAQFRLSPLWYVSHPMAIRGWILVGIALSLLSAIGFGGRWSILALFLFVLGLAQRLTWATGSFEPLLIAILGYLIIGPGSSQPMTSGPWNCCWTTTLCTRLIQVHLWVVMAAGLASQLAVEAWWRGDSVWWLAASQHSNLLSPEWLRGRLLLINVASHSIVLANFLSVATLWHSRLRPVGIASTHLVSMAYGLIGDQLLYGLLLSTATIAFQACHVQKLSTGREV